MHGSFWFGYEIQNFIFKGLDISSITGLIILCVVLGIYAIGFEGLKVLHTETKLKSALLSTRIKPSLFSPQDNASLLGSIPENIKKKQRVNYLVETLLYTAEVVVGYMLMLTVMTFNAYVSLAVLVGVACGYFIFGHLLMERRIQGTQLSMACHRCVQSDERNSAEETVLDDDLSSAAGSSRVFVRPPEEITD